MIYTKTCSACFLNDPKMVQDLLQWVHSEGNIHAWAVGQESCKSCFFKQSKDENLIPAKNSSHVRL